MENHGEKMDASETGHSYRRWSDERYAAAEATMLEIMKKIGASSERPILRSKLRLEASKYIQDTDILDHLMSYMIGKVAPNGKDRFRGGLTFGRSMEYWLEDVENAEEDNVRKQVDLNNFWWFPVRESEIGDSFCIDSKRLKDTDLSDDAVRFEDFDGNGAGSEAGKLPSELGSLILEIRDKFARMEAMQRTTYQALSDTRIQLGLSQLTPWEEMEFPAPKQE